MLEVPSLSPCPSPTVHLWPNPQRTRFRGIDHARFIRLWPLFVCPYRRPGEEILQDPYTKRASLVRKLSTAQINVPCPAPELSSAAPHDGRPSAMVSAALKRMTTAGNFLCFPVPFLALRVIIRLGEIPQSSIQASFPFRNLILHRTLKGGRTSFAGLGQNFPPWLPFL